MTNEELKLNLIDLKTTLFKAAQFLYNPDGTPRLDRTVTTAREKDNSYATMIPNELPKLSIADALANYNAGGDEKQKIHAECQTEEFQSFLKNNGIKALSKFHNGTTARTFLGWISDNKVVVVRIPSPSIMRPDSFDVNRLGTPLMVQPIDTYQVGDNTIEILPFVPVLPNIGLNALDSMPGHTTIQFDQFVYAGNDADKVTFDAHKQFGLDREMFTFTALARVAGYKMQAPRDIGVSSNGSPLFVDPGTFEMIAPSMQNLAFEKLNGALKELDLEELFHWEQTDKPHPPTRERQFAGLNL